MVLLHGCGGSRESTFVSTGWLSALSDARRIGLPLHLPGHGTRSASHDPASYADLAGLVMRDLPAGEVDVVGFSLGAKLALEIAIRAPDRIGRLVLGGVGDNVFAPESIAEAAALALERGATPETPPPVLAFLNTWEPDRNDTLSVVAVLRRPPNPTFTDERLQRIRAPVLIVNGDADPVMQLGSRLTSSLANVRCVTLPGVDHLGLPAQPAFIRHAIEFLA
jgi:pimeloyl-ACP methyl ester carboxylesterase